VFCVPASAQTPDSLLLKYDEDIAELDSILNSSDSLSILDLIDSVLLAPADLTSQIAVRFGYNNNIVANGSSSITQFGLNTGVSYYHKSGAYLDASTYYSDEYRPSVYLTVGAIGYLGVINKYWSVLAEYDRYFYTPNKDEDVEVYTPYTNNLYISNYFKVRKFVFRFDYNVYFGDLVAHRFTPSIGFNLTKKKWLGMDRITLLPSVALWYGSDTVTEYVPNYTTLLQRRLLIQQGRPLFSEKNSTVWGIMNYNISLPLSLSYKKWALLVSYTFNFQKGLPGESVESSRTGYAGVSLIRYFDL
jgi:hypothetical protein